MSDPIPAEERRTAGGRWGRWALIGVVAIAILVLLFTVVFPWIERNISNPTLGG